MQEYSDISFFANLDPFARKGTKNDIIKSVQKGQQNVLNNESNVIDGYFDLTSFALHRKFTGPKWMTDFAKVASKNPDFCKTFEIKLLQIIDDGIVELSLLMAVFETVVFDSKILINSEEYSFINYFTTHNSKYPNLLSKYISWESSNVFGTFTVEGFGIANFINLKNIIDNRIYKVYDNIGFASLKVGQKLVCRIVFSENRYIFSGGLIISIERGYYYRINKEGSTGMGIKINKSDIDFSDPANLVYMFFKTERRLLVESSIQQDLSFEDALIELNHLIIKNKLTGSVDINTIINGLLDVNHKLFLKSLKEKLILCIADYSVYEDFNSLFNIILKKHPYLLREKTNNSFRNQIWNDIQDLTVSNSQDYTITFDEEDQIAYKKLLNIYHDPISNYNKSVELILSSQATSNTLEILCNSYRATEKLGKDLLKKWYLATSINLVFVGELELGSRYYIFAKNLGIDTSRYDYLFTDSNIYEKKIKGRTKRFQEINWGNQIQNITSTEIVKVSRKYMENLASTKIVLNKNLNFKNNIIANNFISATLGFESTNLNNYKNFKSVPKFSIIHSLLISSGLVSINNSELKLTQLGEIYLYTVNDAGLFELLFNSWITNSSWQDFSVFRKTVKSDLLFEKMKANLYKVFNFIFSKGTSTFKINELKNVFAYDYSFEYDIITKNDGKKTKLWNNIFDKCIFEPLILFGLITLNQNEELRLTDQGIYLFGKVESEIDKMIPVLIKKILY